ncbi:MAG TPA: hypothetical protein DCR15_00515 [Arthrobacter bacterium]|nr:hypothetical protein [Arthrobacter sp.]
MEAIDRTVDARVRRYADKCGGSGSARLDQTLAAVASDSSTGVHSAVGTNDCDTRAGRNAENSDRDYFFCAGTGTDMAAIFVTAFGQPRHRDPADPAPAWGLIQLPPGA